jgi:hypothetical protein
LATTHAWTSTGDYEVVARVYMAGSSLSATVTVHVATQLLYYVDAAGASPVPPYSSWATAATNIQDAVDVATPAQGSIVLVTNGVYQHGGRVVYGTMTNRLAVTKPIIVESINGSALTAIQGFQVPGSIYGDTAIRCAYLTNKATLSGFTLAGGATRSTGASDQEQSGGGVWCASADAVVTNCVLVANSAHWSGGGAFGGTLNHSTLRGNRAEFQAGGGAEACHLTACILSSNSSGGNGGGADQSVLFTCELLENSATSTGGGAESSSLDHCTLTSNSAGAAGGGTHGGTLTNCIVYYNHAPTGSNYLGSVFNYCCTMPVPDSGTGNLTAEPRVTDGVHLAADSPCLGAGKPGSVAGADIDGESWLTPPAIGCDEFYAGFTRGSLDVTLQTE